VNVLKHKCALPQVCSDSILDNPHEVFACASETEEEMNFFGLNVTDFQGIIGYLEFLHSITNVEFLSRDGEILKTTDFLDELSKKVEVLLLFYSPQHGITTVMRISSDLTRSRAVKVQVDVVHYQILEGENLSMFMIVQIVNLVFVCILFVDNVLLVFQYYLRYRKRGVLPPKYNTVVIVIDFVSVLLLISYAALVLPAKVDSSATTESVVGRLIDIEWDSENTTATQKSSLFVSNIQELLVTTSREDELDTLANYCMFFLLLRLIMATNIHPRLASLTGTLGRSLDDMWHTSLLVCLLMFCFAAIATWRFGDQHVQFADFSTSLQTQFEMLIGDFPDAWTDTMDLIVYTVLFMMVMFVLVLNFILAIVVEAYMSVREENAKCEIEMDFGTDVFYCFLAFFKRLYHGWPGNIGLILSLQGMNAKFSVGYDELALGKRGRIGLGKWDGLFGSYQSLASFFKHYSDFDFLQPCLPPQPEYMGVAREVEKRVAWLMGKNPPTLRNHLQCMTKTYIHRASMVPDRDAGWTSTNS